MFDRTYLLNAIESRICRLDGILPSAYLPKRPELNQSFDSHVMYRNHELPPKVDLRSYMTPVEDQSKLGTCAANTLAGAYEYMVKRATGRDIDVSRLFIYYNARMRDKHHGEPRDAGCSMTSGIESLGKFGVCLESVWPYENSRVNYRPSERAYRAADKYKINEALRVQISLHHMKSCLAQGYPFAFGLKLFESFDQAARTGIVPMPNRSEQSRGKHGSHAMLAVGYSDHSRSFIVRNSWGKRWGDRGYCYIPYDYLANPHFCFDVWVIRQLARDDFGREHWDHRDTINHHPDNEHEKRDPGSAIEQFQNDDQLIQFMKRMGEKFLKSVVSWLL